MTTGDVANATPSATPPTGSVVKSIWLAASTLITTAAESAVDVRPARVATSVYVPAADGTADLAARERRDTRNRRDGRERCVRAVERAADRAGRDVERDAARVGRDEIAVRIPDGDSR